MKLTEKFKERIEEIKKECGYIYPLTAWDMSVLEYNYIHTKTLKEFHRTACEYIRRLREEH